ncbi:protein kinase [Streptomyces sp. NPDC006879]|uniref:protein kinase domain-containing protein n=1 Tax=Streptomyces sp. NPDC006879 TaxID=3364767 RepID=UPI0036785FF4
MSQDGARGQHTGGSLAGGRYQLRELLGEGGMASVYLAYDAALDRQVAIKTLHSQLGQEASFRERFRREAQAVAKLSHTNIVSVFDTGEESVSTAAGNGGLPMPYIVMEFVRGRSLGAALQEDVARYGAMPAERALKVTADVLAALEASHEVGLVHRDIKPGNVMITDRGLVKVMDFGIARAMQSGVTSMTQTGMVVGTPHYLSPEQALGRAVDARSDLYSVGIMLFQLLTGRLPFDADSPLAIAYAHVQEEPPPPSSMNRALPPAVDALVARALKKNPNERFPSAATMLDACARAASAGTHRAPVIVESGPANSGAGLGAAVFPPLGSATPAPPPPQPQQPYGAAGPVAQGPMQPRAPLSMGPQPSYGYPQQSYPTPPSAGYGQSTGNPPAGGSGASGGRRSTPALLALGAVLLAVGGLTTVALVRGWGGSDSPGGTGDRTASAPAQAGHRGPDRSRTIDPTACSEPGESYNDPDKVRVPDFRYKDLRSVKECFQEAGWKLTEEPKDEAVYGEDTVINQWPAAGTDIYPQDAEITLEVSTGDPE